MTARRQGALFQSAVAAGLVAVGFASISLWHWAQEAKRPALRAAIVDSAPVIPRQYVALVQMTEEAGAAGEQGGQAEAENERLKFSVDPIAAASPFRALVKSGEDHARALQCLTQAIYYEAAQEPEAGQRAVAQVVLNRVRHPAFAKTVCGVVYQRFNASVCQFSFVCDGALGRRPLPALWDRARRIAEEALAGSVYRAVGTATHYHADYVFPRWAPHLAKMTKIGAHIFYRWPGGWGMPRAFSGRYAGGEYIPVFDPSRYAAAAGPQIDYPPVAALPERRAPDDVGGRMDPTKGWKLSIPDPSETRGALNGILARQEETARKPAGGAGVALAVDDHRIQGEHP